jgi:hypothetical protein
MRVTFVNNTLYNPPDWYAPRVEDVPLEDSEETDEPATDFDWPHPPGLVGDIAKYIYTSAFKTIPETAIAAAIAYFAGIVGRAYNVNGDGLNQYIVNIAPSGTGKDAGRSGIKKLNGALAARYPQIPLNMGPENIASPQALRKFIAGTSNNKDKAHPCCMSLWGEIGHTFQAWCSKKASPQDAGNRQLLMQLFTSSGGNKSLGDSRYSDSDNNVADVVAPAFSFFGETTQHAFYKAVNEGSIAEGLLPRITILEYALDKLPEPNRSHNLIVPSDELLNKLKALIVKCNQLEIESDANKNYSRWINVPFDTKSYAASIQLEKVIRERQQELNKSPEAYLSALHSRIEQKTNRIAALLAVGVNPDNPIITKTEMEYAYHLVDRGTQFIIKHFRAGDVGEDNGNLERHNLVVKTIKDYLAKPWTPAMQKNQGITAWLHANRIITYKYLQNLLHKRPAFKNTLNTRKAITDEMLDLCNQDMVKEFTSPTKKMAVEPGSTEHIAASWQILGFK